MTGAIGRFNQDYLHIEITLCYSEQEGRDERLKLTLKRCPDIEEDEMLLQYINMDKRLQTLVDYIGQYLFHLDVKKEEKEYRISLEKILYIDSADGKTFVYTEKDVYESKKTLSGLEQSLHKTPFVRISKNCIVNTEYLHYVKPIGNHRLEAVLHNQESLIVSRFYIPLLKNKLRNGG